METKTTLKADNIQEIAENGTVIYDKIKTSYDPQHKGKFLAIDIDSEEVFLGNTSAEAVELAKKKYPDKIFFVVKIGFDVAEIMAKCIINNC